MSIPRHRQSPFERDIALIKSAVLRALRHYDDILHMHGIVNCSHDQTPHLTHPAFVSRFFRAFGELEQARLVRPGDIAGAEVAPLGGSMAEMSDLSFDGATLSWRVVLRSGFPGWVVLTEAGRKAIED